MDMHIDLCMDVRMDVHIHMRICVSTDMHADLRVSMRIEMCMGVAYRIGRDVCLYVYVCVDIGIPSFFEELGSFAQEHG